MVSERLASAAEEFGVYQDDDEQLEDLASSLEADKNGKPLSTIRNVELILSKDPNLKGCLALDQFERREVLLKDLPWRKRSENRYMTDADDARIRSYIETVYGISSPAKIQDALVITVNTNAFHPVRDYLESRSWDGIERVDELLVDYLGAEDDVYTRAVTRKTLVAAVARIFEPGKKFDYVLTFVGEQGMKKSSFIAALGGEWFSDSFGDIEKKKEVMEQIQGVWLVEIGEMAGMRKADVQSIKQFISKRDDRYRVAYGRRVEYFPRQCVFFATTNDTDFLRDPTGNRRFWPVKVYKENATKDAFTDLNEYERGQIWAEAVELYRKGETLYLSPELEAMAREMQEEHTERDEREGVVVKYLETLLPVNWDEMSQVQRRMYAEYGDEENPGITQRERVCVAEIWCEALGGNQKDMTTHNTKFIHDIMKKLGTWQPTVNPLQFKGYGRQRGYLLKGSKAHKSVF
ncbi:virulence-associated E family protein [Siphonobacter sp. BAB-5385]|uniref:virulence-associated E family protein n=1 Tax=Siphonobacter sp. BAB-5385 TaxID=1864822 RepID=UPI001C3E478C|nr:virulence-associated E family protein [Siphonobacter sp. BAB-5385]